MASTLNSAPAANSSSGNAHSTQNSGRPSLRPSASTKGDGRRQSGSPVDGAQRYVPTPFAPLPLSLIRWPLFPIVYPSDPRDAFGFHPARINSSLATVSLCTCPRVRELGPRAGI